MSFRKLLNLFESLSVEQLDEALGPLANLKAGDLINVFKQTGSNSGRGGASADTNKFSKPWSGGLGQSSEQIDIGKVTSYKDLRKVVGRDNTKNVLGAVFYVDGTAFAAVNFGNASDNPLYKPTADVILAFDPTKLPEQEVTEPPEGMSEWERNRWKEQNQPPAATARTQKRYSSEELQKFTGRQVSTSELTRYIDNVIGLYPSHAFTGVALTADKAGQEKQRERRTAAQTNDELSIRKGESDSYYNNKASLNVALDKYKASKNFNSFDEPTSLIEYLSDTSNYGDEFVYKGNRYKFAIYTSDKVTSTADHFILNKPIEFEIDYRSASKQGYGRLTVKYRFENGQATPISVR